MKSFKGLFRPSPQQAQSRHTVPEQNRSSSPDPILQDSTLAPSDTVVPFTSNTTPSPVQEHDKNAVDKPTSPNKEPQSFDVKDATLNALRLSLSLLSAISDSIPVPGLKVAFAGLETVLGWFDVSSLCPCH